jgi:hypothetical protein
MKLAADLGLTHSKEWNSLVSGTQVYQTFHMGFSSLTIGRLIDLIYNFPERCPPRTGHLGNWQSINAGFAGALDFNQTICTNKLGYPLIYCFTQTEDDPFTSGDTVYLPGSLVKSGSRTKLELFTWNGREFQKRDRSKSYFVPFVKVKDESSLTPLVSFHFSKMSALSKFKFQTEAELVIKNEDRVLEILETLLISASQREGSKNALEEIISHSVLLDGSIQRCTIHSDGHQFKIGDSIFSNAAALAKAAMSSYYAVARPSEFLDQMKAHPPLFPIIASNTLGRLLGAHLHSDFPQGIPENEKENAINLHLHWGARDMAGFLPLHKGYFGTYNRLRSLQIFSKILKETFSDFRPVGFVLLPASIFMLCPNSYYTQDIELLNDLFSLVKEGRSSQNTPAVYQSWSKDNWPKLSDYFKKRFIKRRGIVLEKLPEENSKSEITESFKELSLSEACHLVGLMHEPAHS